MLFSLFYHNIQNMSTCCNVIVHPRSTNELFLLWLYVAVTLKWIVFVSNCFTLTCHLEWENILFCFGPIYNLSGLSYSFMLYLILHRHEMFIVCNHDFQLKVELFSLHEQVMLHNIFMHFQSTHYTSFCFKQGLCLLWFI